VLRTYAPVAQAPRLLLGKFDRLTPIVREPPEHLSDGAPQAAFTSMILNFLSPRGVGASTTSPFL
jgi:hypothetical protein